MEGHGPAPDAKASRKKRKLKSSRTSDAPAAAPAEDRLAALGDAFLASIEAPPVRARKSPRHGPLDSPAVMEKARAPTDDKPQESRWARKRKRKKERALQQTSDAAATPLSAAAPGGLRKLQADMPPPAHKHSVAEMQRRSALGLEKIAAAQKAAKKPSATGDARSGPPRMSAADKRRFMSGKVSDIRSHGQAPSQQKRYADPEEDAEFRNTLREVLEFVTPNLGKRERQQYEDAKIRALGGTVDARQKMPYNVLKRQAKRHDEARAEKLEEEKVLGVSMSANSHRMGFEVDRVLRKKKEMLKEKKKRQEDGFLRLGMGARETPGMATFSKTAVRAMTRY